MQRFITEVVTTNLTREIDDTSDLIAINLQRGREHGLPGYNTFRRACNIAPLNGFNDREGHLSPRSLALLSRLYRNSEDIDLFTGGILERTLPGGNLGPTFACILAEQFRNLRFGDRFWYERNDPVVGFTLEQLTELRKITLSRVICNSSDGIKVIRRWALSAQSKLVPCRSLQQFSLEPWRETHGMCFMTICLVQSRRLR